MNELFMAFIGGGGIAVVISRFWMTKKDNYDAVLMLVKQLQENVNSNNIEIKGLKEEVHQWREKYYKELDQKNILADELMKVRVQLQKFNNNTKP